MTIYLINRGPRPAYHRAPFHPVIVCNLKRIAKWEAGCTGDQAWVWSKDENQEAGGWLLDRWNGLDIDYGHVVRCFTLPDGTKTGFHHKQADLGYGQDKKWLGYTKGPEMPWPLLAGAVWWSNKKLPAWLEQHGAVYPPDDFSRQCILDNIADDGASGFGRELPPHWIALGGCLRCGQVDHGQTGEYPCPQCGLPLLHDEPQLTPYDGPINPGDRFIWEPDKPDAREVCRVTVIETTPVNGVRIHTIGERSGACWNDESRFREACVPYEGE